MRSGDGLALVAGTMAGLALILPAAIGVNFCSHYTSCTECLSNSSATKFCGWCSPGGIVKADGTLGARCGDQRDGEWNCPQHYQTVQCDPVYVCNKTSQTCIEMPPDTAGGVENRSACQETCKAHKPDSNHSNHTVHYNFVCDNSTQTCQKSQTNGSNTFHDFAACNVSCDRPHAHSTPDALLGLWRGVQISEGFVMGEFDLLFLEGGVFNLSRPTGVVESGSITSYIPADQGDAAIPQVFFNLESGPDQGSVRKAIYQVGPQGPETNTTIIAIGARFPSGAVDQALAPPSFGVAMAGGAMEVLFLRACLPDPGLDCQWKGAPIAADALLARRNLRAFAAPMAVQEAAVAARGGQQQEEEEEAAADEDAVPKARRKSERAPLSSRVGVTDPCNSATNCSACTSQFGGQRCGWCTAPVKYKNGGRVTHCSGYTDDGSAEQWRCDGQYHVGPCKGYICNVFPNYTTSCRKAQGTEVGIMTEEQCHANCTTPEKVYACNKTLGQCLVTPPGTTGSVSQQECSKNCTKVVPPPPPPPKVVCNNETLKCEAANNSHVPGAQPSEQCAAACIPKYLCTPSLSGKNVTCKIIERKDPAYASAQTLSECQSTCKVPKKHNCTPPDLQGTYRGILVSGDGTPHGEWDLKLGYCDAELKNSSGTLWKAKVSTGGVAPLTFDIDGAADGGGNASKIYALYTFEAGPQTTRFTLALSAPGGQPPKDWMSVMDPSSGGMVLGLAKCKNDKPLGPIPGGTYCDPTVNPPQMCPPYKNKPPSQCPKCAHPPCLCPGDYPPPPPPPPDSAHCNFARVFSPSPSPTRATDER